MEAFIEIIFDTLKRLTILHCIRFLFRKYTRPQIKQDYPLNLSILISGGKENNYDTISNGE